MNWSVRRSRELTTKILNLATHPEIRYTFVPSERTQSAYQNGYFPEAADLEAELSAFAPSPFIYVPFGEGADVDIIIASAHGGENEAAVLWSLRKRFGDTPLIVSWLWDNHVSHIANLKAALASDVVFVSHAYQAGYVHTPASLVGSHVPACCGQWTRQQASEFFEASLSTERRHKLLINYVIQAPASLLRRRVLEEYRDGLAEADVFLMTKEERTRYFNLSRKERFLDWARYKATVIVPMGHDLSTRVFDALITGQIIIVPEFIDDFDSVIPPEVHEQLGIIRVASLELEDIRSAAAQALKLFDTMGAAGVRARHEYVLETHMLVNRMEQMLYLLWKIADGQYVIESASAHHDVALYLKSSSAPCGTCDHVEESR